jgi:hypothetical protein
LLLLVVVILLLILVHAVPVSSGAEWTTAGVRSGTGSPSGAMTTEIDGLGRQR